MTDRTVPTEPTSDERTIYECTGCGMVTRDPAGWIDMCRKAGGLSCCPERKMVPLAASPAAPGAEVEPVAWYAFADTGNVRLWSTEHARQVRAGGYFLDMQPLYLSPPTTDAIKAQARREALEDALAAIDEHIAGEVELKHAARRAGDHEDARMHGTCGGAMLEIRAIVASLAGKPGEAEGWRPIATAPKDGTRILIFNHHAAPQFSTVHAAYYRSEKSFLDMYWHTDAGISIGTKTVTHWRPLPAPPSAQGGGDAT